MKRITCRAFAALAPLWVFPALDAGCGPQVPPAPSRGFRAAPDPRASSLVLVTLDTFRADAAGCGGSPRAHTPWLDRIARGGIQFETGLAASPLTAPSHTSILSGRIPPRHGVRDNGTFRLPDDLPTLATALHERGFATGGFIAAFPLLGRAGFSRGFDVYDDAIGELAPAQAFRMTQRSGEEVVRSALTWIRGLPAERRFFAWVHLFDSHAPYEPPLPWKHAAGDADYPGDVAWTDDQLGGVVRFLELERPDAWLVLQADHGESLGEHGEETHAIFVYDSTIRVPALLWPAPGGERPGLRRATFRNVDVAATAFELLGFLPGSAPGDGVSVLSEAAGPTYSESLYPFFHYGWSDVRAVREGRWTYIRAPRPELYDTEADPAQTRNLVEERPEIAAAMAAALERFVAEERAAENLELSDADREALESLGYVTETADEAAKDSGGADASGADHATLRDPKDMMRVQSLIYDAMRAMSGGLYDDARRALRSALSRDPENKEANKIMGMLYAEEGRDNLAVDSFRKALDVGPDADDDAARVVLAAALMRLGLYEEAGRHFGIVAHADPENPDAWFNYGQALRAQGRTDEAINMFRQALALKPDLQVARDALIGVGGDPSRP